MIEFDDGFLWIENFKNLRFISVGVCGDFFRSQLFARFGFTGRIADHPGEITDEKNYLMPEILELFHLLNEHRMTQMQIRRGRIESRFDAKRTPFLELCEELFFGKNLHSAALDE